MRPAGQTFLGKEVTEITEKPLFPPLAPVQVSLSRGRDALSGPLAQHAGSDSFYAEIGID
jgi:hypothetical protein